MRQVGAIRDFEKPAEIGVRHCVQFYMRPVDVEVPLTMRLRMLCQVL